MKSNLLLTPAAYHITPFRAWIPEAIDSSLVLCPEEFRPQYESHQIDAIGVADYLGEAFLCEIRRLARKHPIEHVTMLSEFDIVRAARIRGFLQVGGQEAKSAEAFRNKVIMKEYVERAGIPVPPFRAVECALDVFEFIEAYGFPVVVKPVDGAGSVDVSVVRDEAELDRYFAGSKSARNMMVERYLPNEMVHVDGLAEGGDIAFCAVARYAGTCLDYRCSLPLGSVQLAPGSPDYLKALEFAQNVIRALPTPAFTGFHLEIFELADEGRPFVFCEIASRIGGARVNDCVDEAYGVNLAKEWVRRQTGVTTNFPRESRAFRHCGWVVFPPVPGTLKTRPEVTPDWMLGVRWDSAVGERLQSAKNSVHGVVTYLVAGDSEDQVRGRIAESIDLLKRTVVIAEGEAT